MTTLNPISGSVAILAQDPIHVLGLGSYLSPIGLNWWCGLIDCIGDWICLCIDYWTLGSTCCALPSTWVYLWDWPPRWFSCTDCTIISRSAYRDYLTYPILGFFCTADYYWHGWSRWGWALYWICPETYFGRISHIAAIFYLLHKFQVPTGRYWRGPLPCSRYFPTGILQTLFMQVSQKA